MEKKYIKLNGIELGKSEDGGSGGGGSVIVMPKKRVAKTITPTTSQQVVKPDNPDKETLNKVTVEAIPDEYVDTTDATATSDDIMEGKTVYIKGTKVTGTKTFTDIENKFAYGIEWSDDDSSTECERVGSKDLHAELPVQSNLKGYLITDSGAATAMNESNWTSEDRSGASGQVMVGNGFDFYYKNENLSETTHRLMLSEKALDGYTKFTMQPIGAYMAALQRSTNKLSSVATKDDDYRGGVNQTALDNTYKDLRGKPVTKLSNYDFEKYAKYRGAGWHGASFIQWNMLNILYAIEYANWNSRLPINNTLTSDGFRQGGLGIGCTRLVLSQWVNFNALNPFIPCGYTDILGNGSGEIPFTMPFEYDTNGEANYLGSYNSTTTYATGNFVSDGENLYKSKIDSNTGNFLTDTNSWQQATRTVMQQCRYRGIDNAFGHLWQIGQGFTLVVKSDGEGGTSTLFISDNPAHWYGSLDNYTEVGNIARSSGFVKTFINKDGLLVPSETDGSLYGKYKARHYTTDNATTFNYGVSFGGYAASGDIASLGNLTSAFKYGYQYMGSRLAFYK